MFNLLDVVQIKNDDLTHNVPKGTKGVVVDILDNGKAYTVEFFDDNNETIENALFTDYTEEQLEKVIFR